MDEDLRQSLDEIKRDLPATNGELHERIERVETSLLTEFHKWTSPMALRARSHAAAIRALDLEQEALPERINRLEHPPIS